MSEPREQQPGEFASAEARWRSDEYGAGAWAARDCEDDGIAAPVPAEAKWCPLCATTDPCPHYPTPADVERVARDFDAWWNRGNVQDGAVGETLHDLCERVWNACAQAMRPSRPSREQIAKKLYDHVWPTGGPDDWDDAAHQDALDMADAVLSLLDQEAKP